MIRGVVALAVVLAVAGCGAKKHGNNGSTEKCKLFVDSSGCAMCCNHSRDENGTSWAKHHWKRYPDGTHFCACGNDPLPDKGIGDPIPDIDAEIAAHCGSNATDDACATCCKSIPIGAETYSFDNHTLVRAADGTTTCRCGGLPGQ